MAPGEAAGARKMMSDQAGTLWKEISGLNYGEALELHQSYLRDPLSVSESDRAFFELAGPPPVHEPAAGPAPARAASGPGKAGAGAAAAALALAIRSHGHRCAHLDPLGATPPGDAALFAETHGTREEDLVNVPAGVVGGPAVRGARTAAEAIARLRELYQGHIGFEFQHVSNAVERIWFRTVIESRQFHPPAAPVNERKLLQRLTQVEGLERFLHTAFPGQKRFSLEGLDMLVPILDELIGCAVDAGTRSALLGMAHRGRLNVLTHVLNKPYEQLIAEFMGRFSRQAISEAGAAAYGWTGDVKYHLGARRAVRGGSAAAEMLVHLVPNPSHLEWVNPVVEGMTRACDERRDLPGPAIQDEVSSLAILIHGDAAFMGQGIVAETLNLSRLPGYRTGGTIHIISNNQLGFTTSPGSARSTYYASDLAKGFEIPIIHVNADAPTECIVATRIAHAYRQKFRRDVLIDLIGYRRWGHNEGDEPAFTQPRMYAEIRAHPTVTQSWARELERRGIIEPGEADAMMDEALSELQAVKRRLQEEIRPGDLQTAETAGYEAGGAGGGLGHSGAAEAVDTALAEPVLDQLNQALWKLPQGFNIHPRVERVLEQRRNFGRTPPPASGNGKAPAEAATRAEWGEAEALAFACILSDGTAIRLAGQDSGRGTFSHRHAVLHDQETGQAFIPLQALPQARASFEVWDSPLSEQAALGFEWGYSVQAQSVQTPRTLVLWEAQFGDFINTAQTIVDQFIVSARSKWDQTSGLVLLLPHGYEGQGPEHSSARLERFLQLVAEDNLRVANCSTAAQYFHILRRQAALLSCDPRPLIILSPKSLLRNPLAASPLSDFTEGRFQPLLSINPAHPERVRRLILCSGKVYYDLLAARESAGKNGASDWLHAARVEELYPFPAESIAALIASLSELAEVVWLQEEPRNMGAWTFVAPRLRDILLNRLPLRFVGRPRRASTAEGAHHWHDAEQQRLIAAALDPTVSDPLPPVKAARTRTRPIKTN